MGGGKGESRDWEEMGRRVEWERGRDVVRGWLERKRRKRMMAEVDARA